MKSLNICFMIYDSRSGSTLLARKLSEELEDVAVTPEIGFDSLFSRSEDSFSHKSALEVVRDLYRSGDFRNIGIEQTDMEAAVMSMQELITPAELVQTALGLWGTATKSHASRVVVKNGTHAKYWRSILRAWPGTASAIFVFRDPRAVVNSKLRTVRPYHSHEVMAWGGALLAAWRWRKYSELMRQAAGAGVRVLDVQYEALLASPRVEMARVAEFIGTGIAENPATGKYNIPAAERDIHTLVTSGEIRAERSEAWMQELSWFDRAVIESACRTEMVFRGYAMAAPCGRVSSLLFQLAAIPGTGVKICRHYLNRFFRHER